MERRSFLGALTAASSGVALEGSLAEFARAQNAAQSAASSPGRAAKKTEFPENSTIVLVHAAWADGYCWSNIVGPTGAARSEVICAPIPLTSLTNDAAALSWALERTTGPLVLVGHAYSGAVIAAVKEERVKSLVYVSALAPDEGETVEKVFYREPPSPQHPRWFPIRTALSGCQSTRFTRDRTKCVGASKRGSRPQYNGQFRFSAFKQPSPAPGWKSKPSWYLVAEEDRMINPKTQHLWPIGCTPRSGRIPVDHTPMYSAPAVVVDVILEAARKTLSQ